MCFSAPASFAAAAATGLVGTISLYAARSWREIPLAAIPLVFTLQQSVEGLLWLALTRQVAGPWSGFLANMFACIALVLWPMLAPVAAVLVEPSTIRRLMLGGLVAISLSVAGFGIQHIHAHPFGACVVGHSLSYINGNPYPPLFLAGYVACTVGAMVLSSQRALRIFGVILAAGLGVSLISFYAAFVSVWCFFAAAASATLALYFVRARLAVRPS